MSNTPAESAAVASQRRGRMQLLIRIRQQFAQSFGEWTGKAGQPGGVNEADLDHVEQVNLSLSRNEFNFHSQQALERECLELATM